MFTTNHKMVICHHMSPGICSPVEARVFGEGGVLLPMYQIEPQGSWEDQTQAVNAPCALGVASRLDQPDIAPSNHAPTPKKKKTKTTMHKHSNTKTNCMALATEIKSDVCLTNLIEFSVKFEHSIW